MEGREIPMFGFQIRNATTGVKAEKRYLATSKEAIAAEIEVWNTQFAPDAYEAVAILPYLLSAASAKAIGGYLIGSASSDAKKAAARANANKPPRPGMNPRGRPRKVESQQSVKTPEEIAVLAATAPLIPDAFALEPEPAGKAKAGKK